MSRAVAEVDVGWDQARWVRILDRIDHRQAQVGLRFWGPPLWLEVTMNGPDSDHWPAVTADTSWNWQSSEPCHAVAALVQAGADDDYLLDVAGRYAVENLVLNAVHEIGEWFRFDGRRLFPSHLSGCGASGTDQGNGSVSVEVTFREPWTLGPVVTVAAEVDQIAGNRLVAVLSRLAATGRFTYLPHTSISFGPSGPVVTSRTSEGSVGAPPSLWSSSTLDAGGYDDVEFLLELVGRDVHRSLVRYEADRICHAFHVDGGRPWRLAKVVALPDDDASRNNAGDDAAVGVVASGRSHFLGRVASSGV